jgi:serine/threonine-protein kinase
MTIVNSGALIHALRQYQLLSQRQLAEVVAHAHARNPDVRQIAKTLIQRGWFTVYQMNQLLAGRGAALTLGPYQILDRLGKGGQSEVYKARHLDNDWTVALKVIRSDYLLQTSEGIAHFLREVQAMAELNHPNIVEFWDADKVGEAYYFAMEFIEGTDLGKVVQLIGRLTPASAADYVRQAALGLQHAYEHNLVHRDIKPVNLFLTQAAAKPASWHGRPVGAPKPPAPPLVKILDWGLASLRSCADTTKEVDSQQCEQAFIGTADYLSPEQAVDPHSVDIRSDIYSLGCTFYFLLAGRVPFVGATVMQKIVQHQTDEPEPVEVVNPDVPPALAAIVRRMMAKKPDDRFQTPAAVALALTPFCRADATHLPAPRHDTAAPRRTPDDTPRLSGTLGQGN